MICKPPNKSLFFYLLLFSVIDFFLFYSDKNWSHLDLIVSLVKCIAPYTIL